MPRNPKTTRLSTAGYRAMFTPCAPQVEKEIVVISEDEEWMATLTPTPAPAPTPVVAPVYAAAATPAESSATSPTPVPSLAVPVVDEEMGWTCKYYFKQASETAYYHTLLTHVLDDYYPDLHASIGYHCVEYQHPLEATFWKVELVVCGGYDPGYPWQVTWAMPPGAAQPTRRSLAGHDSARRLPQGTGRIS